MNTNTKYYTPELNEFHNGFEYEIKLSNSDYEKKVFNFGAEYFTIKAVINCLEVVRVKCLDREDIESLGWELRTDINADKHIPEYTIGRWYLSDYTGDFFTIYDDSAVDEFCFRGTIKNKNELQKLMVQLNIKE